MGGQRGLGGASRRQRLGRRPPSSSGGTHCSSRRQRQLLRQLSPEHNPTRRSPTILLAMMVRSSRRTSPPPANLSMNCSRVASRSSCGAAQQAQGARRARSTPAAAAAGAPGTAVTAAERQRQHQGRQPCSLAAKPLAAHLGDQVAAVVQHLQARLADAVHARVEVHGARGLPALPPLLPAGQLPAWRGPEGRKRRQRQAAGGGGGSGGGSWAAAMAAARIRPSGRSSNSLTTRERGAQAAQAGRDSGAWAGSASSRPPSGPSAPTTLPMQVEGPAGRHRQRWPLTSRSTGLCRLLAGSQGLSARCRTWNASGQRWPARIKCCPCGLAISFDQPLCAALPPLVASH